MLFLFRLRGLKLMRLCTPRNLRNKIFEVYCDVYDFFFTTKYVTTTTKLRTKDNQTDGRTRKQRGKNRVARPTSEQTETHYDILGRILGTN